MEVIWVLLGAFVLWIIGSIGAKWLMSGNSKKPEKQTVKAPEKKPVEKPAEKPAVKKEPNESVNEKWVPMEYLGRRRSYAYTGVRLYIVPGQEPDFRALDPGDDLYLVQEKDNEYDKKAIRVETHYSTRAGNVKIGYLKKNKLQAMVNDYINMDLPILAHIETIEDDEGWIEIAIAFYRDPVDDDLEDDMDFDD